jgi:dTDP-4-dehydrorhamnose reductase
VRDTAPTAPEIWGGVECTVNRVGGEFRSQLAFSGHLDRIESDLDAFEGLGLAAIRYPVLWEHVEASGRFRDFRAADRAMSHLQHSPMRPIVGLLHHGSGPRTTDLTDPLFAEKLADYARVVALRYPSVDAYTPVNEPLTTARFSGLYGHWYPHAHDDRSFVRMLLAQVRGTVLAMRAIREVTPSAALIQTEDLGRAGGTPRVRRQVAFENLRRWLTFDLLCGRVVAGHPLYDYLTRRGGADPAALAWLAENPCPPDVIGINHYRRSNRWLDERLSLYERSSHGGNGRIRYADVAAFDAPLGDPPTLLSLIQEAWHTYGIPVALTEVHVDGDARERVAWWVNAFEASEAAVRWGAQVSAVTAWSLLGSFDWNTLCTTRGDRVLYEEGVFEVSTGSPRETALAEAIRVTSGASLVTPMV